ncbi:hypothetical protein ABKV19_022527 [Rosa sericea]
MGVEVSSQRSIQPRQPSQQRRPRQPRPRQRRNNNGILLNQKEKCWVDEKSNKCFMVYPKALTITWADSAKDNRYWHWTSVEDSPCSNVFIDAAELINVCWLDVQGKIDSTKLSSGTLYEVVFIVKLKQAASGWKIPVNFRLTLPDGSKQERKADDLNKIRREEWREIPVGEVIASPGLLGNIEFSMYERESGQWKSGLLIKGVVVRPKNKED